MRISSCASFVLKSKRVKDSKDVVAKLLSLRWMHVAVNEWLQRAILRSALTRVRKLAHVAPGFEGGYNDESCVHAANTICLSAQCAIDFELH